jgi:hypothetical protein
LTPGLKKLSGYSKIVTLSKITVSNLSDANDDGVGSLLLAFTTTPCLVNMTSGNGLVYTNERVSVALFGLNVEGRQLRSSISSLFGSNRPLLSFTEFSSNSLPHTTRTPLLLTNGEKEEGEIPRKSLVRSSDEIKPLGINQNSSMVPYFEANNNIRIIKLDNHGKLYIPSSSCGRDKNNNNKVLHWRRNVLNIFTLMNGRVPIAQAKKFGNIMQMLPFLSLSNDTHINYDMDERKFEKFARDHYGHIAELTFRKKLTDNNGSDQSHSLVIVADDSEEEEEQNDKSVVVNIVEKSMEKYTNHVKHLFNLGVDAHEKTTTRLQQLEETNSHFEEQLKIQKEETEKKIQLLEEKLSLIQVEKEEVKYGPSMSIEEEELPDNDGDGSSENNFLDIPPSQSWFISPCENTNPPLKLDDGEEEKEPKKQKKKKKKKRSKKKRKKEQ